MELTEKPFEDRNFIRPLCEAENEFLQVLLTDFRVKSEGKGLELTVKFDGDSPAIWLRKAKSHILQYLPEERRAFYQNHFKELVEKENVNYHHSDKAFPFRFGNGGTLPVARVGDIDYYCLFYRDIHPIGWNIANGGANDLHDLLHPASIIERELREELIVVEPLRGRRYIFDWHDARLRDHPDFALANRLWMERFRNMNFPEFKEIPLPLKWVPAFDSDIEGEMNRKYDSVVVEFGNNPPVHTGYGLLNITGEDFSIEFDRIAKLAVGSDAIFCDGELIDGQLLNQVVGLFEVQKFNTEFLSGSKEFFPDRFFWNGRNRTGDDINKVIEEYLHSRKKRKGFSGKSEIHKGSKLGFDLCPITRSLIDRFLQIENQQQKQSEPYDVFISFASQDKQLAKSVYDRLIHDYRVFFSDISVNHGAFSHQIDQALDTAWALVVVGSKPEHLYKSWVQFEWESFHNDILSGRKPKETPFVAFVTDVDLNDLPRPFRNRQAVRGEINHLNDALQRLKECICKP